MELIKRVTLIKNSDSVYYNRFSLFCHCFKSKQKEIL